MKQTFFLIIILSFVALIEACHSETTKPTKPNIKDLDEKILNANKLIVRDETKDIHFLLKRYHWKMKTTGTGMYYSIDVDKEGSLLQKGDKVDIAYSISLINGKEVYNSTRDSIKTIVIEESDEPVGVHELLKMMSLGDKAKAIIPSYMAYGILGDNDQIPPYATLIYRIEIINIHKNNKN